MIRLSRVRELVGMSGDQLSCRMVEHGDHRGRIVGLGCGTDPLPHGDHRGLALHGASRGALHQLPVLMPGEDRGDSPGKRTHGTSLLQVQTLGRGHGHNLGELRGIRKLRGAVQLGSFLREGVIGCLEKTRS